MTARTIAIAAAFVAATAAFLFWFFLDPRYHAAAELDQRPYPLHRIDLDFPRSQGGVEYFGKLKLEIYIARDGSVERVEVASAGVPARFRDAAIKAVRATPWEPGRIGWRRVNSVKVFEVDFEPPIPGLGRGMAPD